MPRDSNGVYTLPAGNPVIPGTIIASGWANPTMGDIGNELTDSLSRSGEGGMLAPLRLVDGTIGVPGLSWVSEITSGFYRAGTQDVRLAMGGGDVAAFKINMGADPVANPVPGISTGVLRLRGFDPHFGENCASIQAGASNGGNMRIGPSEILTLSDGNPSALYINNLLNTITSIGLYEHSGLYISSQIRGYDQGDLVFQTQAAIYGGLFVNNLATGTGIERVLTTADLGGAAGNVFPGPDPTLANSVAAIRIGATDPDTDPHIAMGPTLIQAKGDATTVANLLVQQLGGATYLFNNALSFLELALAGQMLLRAANNSAGQFNQIIFTQADGTVRGLLGFDTSANLEVRGGTELRLQNSANGIASLGDRSATGCYLLANGTTNAQIVHKNNVVLRSTTPGNGGVLVNGLYGLERVLTEGDIINTNAEYNSADIVITSSNVPKTAFDLKISLQPGEVYIIEGMFPVSWVGTTTQMFVELETSATPGFMVGGFVVTNKNSGSTFLAVQGLIGNKYNVTIYPTVTSGEWLFNLSLTIDAGPGLDININFGTTGISASPLTFKQGASLSAVLIP